VRAVAIVCLPLAAMCLGGGLAWTRALRRRLELVARAEHELRGPATALALACERLHGDPAAGRHAAVLEAQLDHLRAGLADLEAARRGARARRRPERVELAAVVSASLEPWRSVLRHCSLDWRAGAACTTIDRRRLAQALGNLLANSAEHGAGDLRLRARRVSGAVRLELRNRNAGPLGADRDTAGRGAGRASAGTDRAFAGRKDRGHGIPIAARAARDLGGRLLVRVGDGETVAVLEIPEDRPPEDVAA
jgi:signal transduction histidine kinase